MNCPKCGNKMKEDSKFCSECGYKLEQQDRITQTQDLKENNKKIRKNNKKKAIIAVICIFSIIVCSTVGIFCYVKFHSSDNSSDKDYTYLGSGFTDVSIIDESSALEAIDTVKDSFGVENVNEELASTQVNTVDTFTYYSFQQFYRGVEVYGKTVTIFADDSGYALGLTSNCTKIDKLAEDYDDSDFDRNDVVIYGEDNNLCSVSFENDDFQTFKVFTDVKNNKKIDSICQTFTENDPSEYSYQQNDNSYLLYDETRNLKVLNANKKVMKKVPRFCMKMNIKNMR